MEHLIFETERLRILRYRDVDIDDFYSFNSNADVMRYIRPVKTYEECVVFLNENLAFYEQQPLMGRWRITIKESGAYIGSFSLLFMEDNVQMHLGYALLPQFQGMGYATESLRGGVEYAFGKAGLQQVFCITTMENRNSQKVLLKCGFLFVEDYMSKEGELLRKYIRER
jgi:[ribosomal protein S5]-alanine N-acetyltransferase